MTNTFTGNAPYSEYFMSGVQDKSDKLMASKAISTVWTNLPERVLHNRYTSRPVATDGVAQVDYNVSAFSVTDDTLTVNRRATVSEHVDSIEKLQTDFNLIDDRATEAAYSVRDAIDQYMLNLPVSFSGVADLDNGTFGGGASDGAPYQVTTSNPDEITDDINESLDLNDAAIEKGRFVVVSPKIKKRFSNFLKNNGFNVSDDVIVNGFDVIRRGENGFTGRDFDGLMVFQSNNLTHDATLGLATNPTDGDTLTFTVPGNGGAVVTSTITFVDTLSGTAGSGEVHITASVDATRANLAEYLNLIRTSASLSEVAETEATNAGYQAPSQDEYDALKRAQITATNNDSTDTLAVVVKGSLSVGETLTDATDAWGTVGTHCVAGVMGAMDLAIPSDGMEYVEKPVSGKHGWEVVTSRVYNGTIWELKKGQIFDVYLYV